jgi:hypothetical protein
VSERAEGRETIVTLAVGLPVGFALSAGAISRFLALGKIRRERRRAGSKNCRYPKKLSEEV